MSVKHLRTAVAALALVAIAAIPANADPWAADASQTAATSPAHTGAGSLDPGLAARSAALNDRYGLGGSSSEPLVVYQDASGDGFEWGSAGIGAAVALVGAGGAAALTVRRRPAISG
jgi:hypothetical protein